MLRTTRVAVATVLAALLALPPAVLAQPSSLPTEILRSPGGVLQPGGFYSYGTEAKYIFGRGTFKREGSTLIMSEPAEDRSDHIEPPWWRAMSASLRTEVFTFDSFERGDLGNLDVTRTSLAMEWRITRKRTARVHDESASFGTVPATLGFDVPYVRASLDVGTGEEHLEGLADLAIHAAIPINLISEGNLGWDQRSLHATALLGATLPTGDVKEALGYGDPTAWVGVQLAWDIGACNTLDETMRPATLVSRKSSKGTDDGDKAESCVGTLWPRESQKGGFDWTKREAIYPRRQIVVDALADYNGADPDLSYVQVDIKGVLGWERVLFEAGLQALVETGDGVVDPPDFSRDADRKLDFVSAIRIRLRPPDRTTTFVPYLTLGLRAPLRADGLSDDLTPTIGIGTLLGRLPSQRRGELSHGR